MQVSEPAGVGPRAKEFPGRSSLPKRFTTLLSESRPVGLKYQVGQVLAEANELCVHHQILPRTAIEPISAISLVQHPDLEARSVAVQVALTLWVIAVDDLFDSAPNSEAIPRSLLTECLQAAYGADGPAAGNLYAEALWALECRLAASRLWPSIFPFWVEILTKFVAAHLYEHNASRRLQQAGGESSTSVAEYLRHGRHSIGLPWLLVSGLALGSDPSAGANLPRLVRLAVQCGLVMRLGNDLATSLREEKEGSVNCLVLINRLSERKPRRWRTVNAQRSIRERLQRERARAFRLGEQIQTDSAIEARFLRVMDLGIAYYEVADFREWNAPPPVPTSVEADL